MTLSAEQENEHAEASNGMAWSVYRGGMAYSRQYKIALATWT